MTSPTEDFVHLHVHSEFSLLDGLSKIPDLIARTQKLGQPAVALTDHGSMHGTIDFYNAATKAGVKPIIGVEAYMTRWGRPMSGRNSQKDRNRHHLLLLAQNQTGYENLLKLVSEAELNGYYYRPRVDADLLAKYNEGLICSTGCLAAEVPCYLNDEKRPADPKMALERLHWYLDVFGRDRFYIELQEHNIPSLHKINKTLLEWAQKYDVGLIATNDVHYVRAEDATPHDILLCVQTSSLLDDENRMSMPGGSYYLKSRAEMEATFRPFIDLPSSAFTNTVKIAEMCNVDLSPTGYHLPHFPVPDGYNAETFLRHLTEKGLEKRYGKRAKNPDIQARKEHELKIIHQMGFDTYYLIVWDLCEYARKRNIWWNVRGSGAGSLVAYATGITNLDPLPNNLIFERFLNPGRVSMPDFDLDYPDDQRDQMIEYTIQKYGEDQVAQIVVFGTMKARGSVRDVARVMDIPLEEVDKVAKLIPGGPKATIAKGLEEVTELHQVYEKNRQMHELIDTAQKLEGVARHVSIHPAAVIVADKPLVNYTPLRRSPSKGVRDYITQYTYPVLESLGLLKLDFLGLSTLTIMRVATDLIQKRHGIIFTLDNIPTDDPRSYELLTSGEVTGVFQVESEGMRRMLRSMRPTRFEHIVAAISLYRPGPMQYIPDYVNRMHGREPVIYHHPSLESILAETYGIIVYQEQIIQIASELAGYTPGDADLMRRAVAKKKKKEMAQHEIQFIEGAVEHGVPRKNAEKIYEDIVFFANYGFNKSHAADYAVITVQTAYLKVYYPVEYMAALLTVALDNQEKVTNFITESRKMGIAVLPPDINHSDLGFAIQEGVAEAKTRSFGRSSFDFDVPEGSAIRFGLGAVKNVGHGPVEEILRAREEGPFTSLEDFCDRTDLRQVNKRALECLIKVGAFDQFEDREKVLAVLDRMMQLSSSAWEAKDSGQISLFEMFDMPAQQSTSDLFSPPPTFTPVPIKERLDWEKELLGVYVSEHPLERVTANYRHVITCMSNEVSQRVGRRVALAGMVAGTRTIFTKKGDRMAFVTLEDLQGRCDLTVFPKTFASTPEHLLEEGSVVLVRGKVEKRDDHINILVDEISDNFSYAQAADKDDIPGFAASPPPPTWEDEDPFPGFMEDAPEYGEAPWTPVYDRSDQRNASQEAGERRSEVGERRDGGAREDEISPVPQPAPRQLRVRFPLGADSERNNRLLIEVVALLRSHRGQDHFLFEISDARGVVEIDFPNDATHYCTALEEGLVELLGNGCLEVVSREA